VIQVDVELAVAQLLGVDADGDRRVEEAAHLLGGQVQAGQVAVQVDEESLDLAEDTQVTTGELGADRRAEKVVEEAGQGGQ